MEYNPQTDNIRMDMGTFVLSNAVQQLFYWGSRFLGLCLLFLSIYPLFFKSLPVPTDRLIQLMGLATLVLEICVRKHVKYSKPLLAVFAAAVIMAAFSFVIMKTAVRDNLYMVKWFLDIVFLSMGYYFIIRYFQWISARFSFVNLLDFIIYAAIVQAIISFYFFFNPSQYEVYLSFLNAEVNSGISSRIGLLEVRLMGVGNTFFAAVMNYGMDLLILCTLPYLKGSRIFQRKWLYWSSIFLIVAAGILSTRTFIVAIGLALAFVFIMEHRRFFRFIKRIFKFLILLTIFIMLLFWVFSQYMDVERLQAVGEWAFEVFYSFSESGKFESRSTDTLASMIRFPTEVSTWLLGDGMILNPNGSYYQGIDIGWLRMLYYYGMTGIVLFILLQAFYCGTIASLVPQKAIKRISFFFFVFVLVLNIKGLVNIDKYIILFVLGAGLTQVSKQNKEIKEQRNFP